jgi:predicted outer membrane repeat protein
MRVVFLFALVIFSVSTSSPSSARTWYILPDGTGDASTIQAGIDSAAAGDLVLLAAGTYRGVGNRDIDFSGKAIVVASEDGKDVTIIDCQNAGRGFCFHSGEGAGSVLQGVTIRYGYAEAGGAVYCTGSSPTLTDCLLSRCTAVRSGTSEIPAQGGGMYCLSSSPTLTFCTFYLNPTSARFSHGGGMYCESSTPTLTNCVFSANSATGLWNYAWGGGISCSGSEATFTDCAFFGNSAGMGGGGMECSGCAMVGLSDCTFSGNVAGSGGGLECSSSSVTIASCEFSENDAVGGGIRCINSSLALTYCVFFGNTGSGICCEYSPLLTLTSCTFSENSAVSGGGMFCDDCSPTLEKTIIAFSTSGEAIAGGSPTLSCCGVFGNAGGDWIGSIAGQDTTSGNFCLDPMFCDRWQGDVCLNYFSPCAPGNHPRGDSCGVIGAYGVGCDRPTSAVPITWGRLKAMYR